ncbi:MAG: tetratricopeptide repeat protein [Balneola sp.]
MILSSDICAQPGNDFQIANRFMQQQKYEDALPIFRKLAENNPTEYYFFERYIECFIQLKQYDEGLNVISNLNAPPNYQTQVKVLEGELYHFKGDTTRAYSIWNKNLDENSRNLQVYIFTSNVMSDLNEFQKAVDVLRTARTKFNNPQLFFNDISSTLLQAGNYEEAVQEWISWLIAQPDQSTNIQRALLRYNDPLLNDITILEIEDKLNEIPVRDPAYNTLFRIQVWLLQENKLYRRAFASAKAFESSTSNYNYSLFQLGRSLRRNKEYQLAVDAFSYYIEKADGNLKWQSREELAKVYSDWAKQIEDYNLDISGKKDTLFKKALFELDQIIHSGPNYRNLNRVLLLKSEIVLDYTHDSVEVEKTLALLKQLNKDVEIPEVFYIQGRIHIAKKEYSSARIALTKSNKLAGIGELAEKTRYFLALTDFFSGDYEFAVIQLKTLGRQSTSYYANDALELRLWIQEGLSQDSTGIALAPFASAYYETITGNDEQAKKQFMAILESNEQNSLFDDVLIQLTENPTSSVEESFNLSNEFLSANAITPIRERMMWQRAIYADQALKKALNDPEYAATISITNEKVQSYYEELILDYPQGFYAPIARKRLQELSNRRT